MNVLINPHGIAFNPMSVADSLLACLRNKKYEESDLFLLNEIWNNWDFHSRFSHTDKETALLDMNESVAKASTFLRKADWLIITFGSSYQYFLKREDGSTVGVANCHKASGQLFEKRLLSIEEMVEDWQTLIQELVQKNPSIKIIFTVSPVKYLRDGVIENSRSKARLLEVAHQLVTLNDRCFYFPAYEILTDVLRDYRFYEKDMAHPNVQAIHFIWEQFISAFFNESDKDLLSDIEDIELAMQHRPRFPNTEANKKFKLAFLKKLEVLQRTASYLDLKNEFAFFESQELDLR